jgi:hypothetical protein
MPPIIERWLKKLAARAPPRPAPANRRGREAPGRAYKSPTRAPRSAGHHQQPAAELKRDRAPYQHVRQRNAVAGHVRNRRVDRAELADAGLNENERQKNTADECEEIPQRGHGSSLRLPVVNLSRRRIVPFARRRGKNTSVLATVVFSRPLRERVPEPTGRHEVAGPMTSSMRAGGGQSVHQ